MTRGQGLTCFIDMAKALQRLGEIANSTDTAVANVDTVRAVFEAFDVYPARVEEALKAHGVAL